MTPAQRAAAIRRGQAVALSKLGKLDAEALRNLRALYFSGAATLRQRVAGYADPDGYVRIEQMQNVIDAIDGVLDKIAERQAEYLTTGIQLGAATVDEIAGITGAINASTSAVDAIGQLQQADGLQLSDRLWRLNAGAKQAVGDEVKAALVRGDSGLKAARAYTQRGMPVPVDIDAQAKESGINSVNKILNNQLIDNDESALYQAQRVFRTEINRAHNLAYIDSVDHLDDVVGYKFNLSSNHRKKDICDMHAGANLYGMGRGVYPASVIRRIYPAHPNTTSYVTAVFEEEVTDADKQKDAGRIDWLKRQPASTQTAVLGKQKQIWLIEGKLTERTIGSSVKSLKTRIKD